MSPIEDALAPDVDVTGQEDGKDSKNLHETRPSPELQGHRERIKKRDLDVEQQKIIATR